MPRAASPSASWRASNGVLAGTTRAAASDGDVPTIDEPFYQHRNDDAPVFAFEGMKAFVGAKTLKEVLVGLPDKPSFVDYTQGVSPDKPSYWYLAGLAATDFLDKPSWHCLVVFDKHGTSWDLLAASITPIASAADQAKKATAPLPLERAIGPGSEDVAKLFESTIGDPATFAKTASSATETSLYGSEVGDYAQGKEVAAKLKAWNLVFKVRDGVRSGMTATKQLAWVAANVDAAPAKKQGAKAQPYRVFAVYAKSKAGWQLAAASFSVVSS